MKTDRNSLEKFVLAFASDQALARQALQQLGPYFADAERGIYPLVMAWHVNGAEAARAISCAVAAPVAGTVLASASKGPSQMTQAAPGGLTSIAKHFHRCRRDDLYARLDPTLREDLIFELYESLGMAMQLNLLASHTGFFGGLQQPEALAIGLTPMLCVFYSLAYAVLGDDAETKKLGPMVELCRKAVPLGEIAGRPGNWVILTG